jgi:hypothetical protein
MVKNLVNILSESIFVGVGMIMFLYIASYLLKVFNYPMVATPSECKKWNETYIMEATTFLAGFMFHIVAEYAKLYFTNAGV